MGKPTDFMKTASRCILFVALQNLLNLPQLPPDFCWFAVLFAAQIFNSSWGMFSNFCDAIIE